jgi:enoyl-CoA hydratase/carnithine racemase
MPAFDAYAYRYRFMKIKRQDGVLQVALHTDGGPLRWNLDAQAEFAQAFADIGADRDNRIVILTGTGDEFSGPGLIRRRRFFTARS